MQKIVLRFVLCVKTTLYVYLDVAVHEECVQAAQLGVQEPPLVCYRRLQNRPQPGAGFVEEIVVLPLLQAIIPNIKKHVGLNFCFLENVILQIENYKLTV